MKKLFLLLSLGLLSVSFAATAQTAPPTGNAGLKVGYISSTDLLAVMPELAKADTALRQYAEQYKVQIDKIQADLQKKYTDYQAKDKAMTDAQREVAQREIQQIDEGLQSLQRSAEEKVGKKKEELYKPILEKADKAIKDVAKEKGFDYIFDASAGNLLYAREGDNILPFVKAKLGIK